MQITVEIPDSLAQAIKLPEEEITARLHVELAIRLYRKNLLNFGKARDLAKMTYWDFYELLGKEGIGITTLMIWMKIYRHYRGYFDCHLRLFCAYWFE